MVRLSQPEESVLRALWNCPTGGIIAQVRNQLLHPLPYTTLASILHQLVRKGYAQSFKRGRQHWFMACLSPTAYGEHQLAKLTVNYFHGSYAALVAYCVRQGSLTLAEVVEVLHATTMAKT